MSAPLSAKARAARCGYCNRAGVPLKKCATCRATSYCGAACQKYGWPTHKALCAERGTPTTCTSVVITMKDGEVNVNLDACGADMDNAATGVPVVWASTVMSAVLATADDSAAVREAYKRFVLAQPILTDATVDFVVGLVRETCVGHAFDTRGTVDMQTGWVLDEDTRWAAAPAFNAKLEAIADAASGPGATYSCRRDVRGEVRALAGGLMFKRAKGPRHPRTVYHNGRCFVFILYRAYTGTWFNTSLKRCGMCCRVCRSFKAAACRGCGEARYCSERCQKEDWDDGHREDCALLSRLGHSL